MSVVRRSMAGRSFRHGRHGIESASICPVARRRRDAPLDVRPIGADEALRLTGRVDGGAWVAGWQFGLLVHGPAHACGIVQAGRPCAINTGVRLLDTYALEIRVHLFEARESDLEPALESMANAALLLGYRYMLLAEPTATQESALRRAGWLQSGGSARTWCAPPQADVTVPSRADVGPSPMPSFLAGEPGTAALETRLVEGHRHDWAGTAEAGGPR